MNSMTVQEIKRNLQYSEDFIDEIQIKKKKIQEQYFELEVLLKKLATLQKELDNRLRRRKRKINSYIGGGCRNHILSRYISGMQELLDGKEVKNVYEGLRESERRIKNRIMELERRIDDYERQLLYQKDRRDYWWRQLAMTIAKEG